MALNKWKEYHPLPFCGFLFDIGHSFFHAAGQVAPQAIPDRRENRIQSNVREPAPFKP
jgi:hypothetical protein